jgi:glycosyltransferase involved in cell wall biosynthesis
MKLAAVIPAYNVSETIGEVVERTLPFVDRVIVVDDGSGDNTALEAKKQGAEIVSLAKNTGKANATRVGLKECDGFEVVVTLDGDLQHCPEEIPKLVEEVRNGSHLCIGSRFFNDHSIMPFGSRLSNKTASTVISFFAGQKLTDPQSGFRALDGKILPELELRAERYAIEHIMILEAARKGFVIKEAPISCIYGEEQSNVKIFSDTLRVVYDLLRFILR